MKSIISFEMIENVTVKEEVFETASKELPADSQGNTKPNDYIFSDPGFEIYEKDNVNYEESGTAVYSEDAIEVKYSYDAIDSREVDNPNKEIVTHQGLSETNAEENEQAITTTTTADLAKCLKMPNIQLKVVPLGKYGNSPKIAAGSVEENVKCEKSLDDSSEASKRSDTQPEERPFKCREIACSKSFKTKYILVRHQRIHSEEKPFKCSQCSKSFKCSTNLKYHERIHSGEKPYACNFCEKSFSKSSNLRVHETIHSGNRPYKCSFCEKSFKTSSALSTHKTIHARNRPYKCSCCEKSYQRRSELNAHQRVHKLQKEISDVHSVFSKNVLERRSRLQNEMEINNASNSVLPTEKVFKIYNYGDRPFVEMIENVTVKKEVIETAPKELPADSQGNTKRDDIIVTDPWFAIYQNDNVNYEESETAVHSKDAIEIKYSYDEIESREVDNRDKEIVTHQGLLETNAEENEQAKTMSAADFAKCLKMPNIQLKGVPLGKHRYSRKIAAGSVEENVKCEKALDDSSEPNIHSDTLSEERPFKCREIACSKSFKRKCTLIIHQRIHSEEKPYKCAQCSKSFTVSTHLKDHERTHSGEKPYKCSSCSNSFRSQSNLRTHQQTHSDVRLHQCSLCQKSFKTAAQLKRHARIHSGEGSITVHYSDNTKRHKEVHTGETRQKCPVVEKTFPFRQHFKKHLECKHGKTNEEPMKKSFHQLSDAKRHETIQNGERPYKCSSCETSFRRKGALKEHETLHTGERNFNCSFCSKSFLYSRHLKIHERTHTGERPFNCSVCSNSFMSASDLKRHEMIHTGYRPHKCSFCSKTFHHSSAAKQHEMIHTGERPHKCSSCEKTFIKRSNLKNSHIK